MKTKLPVSPLVFRPSTVKEKKPVKSLRPSRSMSGIKSLRPKTLPVVAAEVTKGIQ